MIKILLLISLLPPRYLSISEGTVYAVGQLLCKGQPYAYEHVRIYEKNYVFRDSEWMETKTDQYGNFSMKVWGSDYPTVTPYVYVPNYCGSKLSVGRRCSSGGLQINIPASYITERHVPEKEFDIGSVELHNNDDSERLGLGYILWGVFAKTMECKDY
ncbi:hypothetical protein GCK72_018974 [Caenorhabditis remanei]|uniref:Uncharacterized protein n=1 Tax=Caenorhabditis remanei TaxID=31234 RepID=A0A6A5GDC4_CAERE|nr:hypothetical protein GCK72_018974 [Caenorhabditis remanei]KAF1752419.1 hypothetical protein GCK72_018974 [Caenorhabditis remanei]